MSYTPDTIVAIATPPGRGGIGVVRLSGSQAMAIAAGMLRVRSGFVAGKASFGYLLDPATGHGAETRTLDEVVVTYFAGPRSYTGEDVLEIATHGAPVVLEAVVHGALQRGARLAEPGEFTQRAFLSGRLDLTQAEAVHDLISATTLHQARLAANQMGGALSRAVQPIKQDLIHLIATLEAGIDFAEDDLEVQPNSLTASRLAALLASLEHLEHGYHYGKAVREGLTLAIVGRPNAGKSSLFNALLERDRAIVTATPGTTRDAITERVSFAGIPVEITDTAGLRETTDEIEALGIARSREVLAEAALVLLVVDGTADPDPADLTLLQELAGRSVLVALSKCDLVTPEDRSRHTTQLLQQFPDIEVLPISARTQEGMSALRTRMQAALLGNAASLDTIFLTNERQHAAVLSAKHALTTADTALREDFPHEMVLLDLHTALSALDGLTGTTTTDDILHLIFSTFCIGK